MDSIAQKEPATANHAFKPPSGNVRAEAVDMREATRSGSLEVTWDDICAVKLLAPSSACSWASSPWMCASSKPWRESSFSRSPDASGYSSVVVELKVFRYGWFFRQLSSAPDRSS